MCNHPSCSPDRRTLLAGLTAAASSLFFGVSVRPGHAQAAPIELPKPGPKDTCPVCGMFVAKYREWVATVLFADGTPVHFDGAKDFFKYLADVGKYSPGRSREQIVGMGVTEYYALQLVEAKDALYVIGSDVLGPMGHELIPLMNQEDGDDYMKDHFGKQLLTFEEVSAPLLAMLDAGKFE
jgi:copper chaperone NosL